MASTPESADEHPEAETPAEASTERDVGRWALVIIATGVVVAFLYFARVILVPVVLAVFLAYVLNPLVELLQKLRVPKTDLHLPRFASASLVVIFSVVVLSALGLLLGDQMRQLGSRIPSYTQRIAEDLGDFRSELKRIEKYFDEAVQPIRPDPGNAEDAPGRRPPGTSSNSDSDQGELVSPNPSFEPSALQRDPSGRTVVVRSQNSLWTRLSPYVTGGITGLVWFAVQSLTFVFVLFFVLLQAPAFKEKLLRIGGTTEAREQAILGALDDINSDVQGYLFGRALINAGLGAAVTTAFFIYGLNYALLLGILAGLSNFIPYFGAIIGMSVTAAVAYMQFGLPSVVVTTLLIYFGLNFIENNLVTPILLSRQLELNSLAVLLGIIFWGWLWGAVGMILAIPILAVMRSVSSHVDGMEPVAEFLRE